MPVVKFKHMRFIPRWKPEWLKTLGYIDEHYRRLDGCIDWKQAELDGLLDSLPNISRKDISRYWSSKKKFRKRDHGNAKSLSYKTLAELNRSVLKKSYRFLWTEKQKRLLKKLVKKHRRSKLIINWQSLWNDPLRKQLPKHYTLKSLRRYWDSTQWYNPESNARTALDWKKKHPDRYRENQRRFHRRRKKDKNKFLYNKIELRRKKV